MLYNNVFYAIIIIASIAYWLFKAHANVGVNVHANTVVNVSKRIPPHYYRSSHVVWQLTTVWPTYAHYSRYNIDIMSTSTKELIGIYGSLFVE
jgi:hypothetical protein